MPKLLLACLALLLACPLLAASLRDDFTDPSLWSAHPDGGNAPAFASVPAPGGRLGRALRLTYRDTAPHWGNLARAVSLPDPHGVISVWLYRQSGGSAAKMHLYLIEPDGDLWMRQLTVGQDPIGQMPPRTWRQARLHLDELEYQPRGNGVRERGKANRLLIGCNYADLEVCMADLQMQAQPEVAPGWQAVDEGLAYRARLALSDDNAGTAAALPAGWWEPESDGRWTGKAGPGVIRLPAWPGRDYFVTLQVLGGPRGAREPGSLGITLGGKPVADQPGPRKNERWLVIPAERVTGKQVDLTLTVPTHVPGGPDTRTLGVKVASLDAWAVQRTPAAAGLLKLGPARKPRLALFVPPGESGKRTAQIIAGWGYEVALLGCHEVANPALLDPARFAALAVMDDRFPAAGQEALIHYLCRGGHLVTLRGYAFDRLLVREGGTWAPGDPAVRINTHFGIAHDALGVNREQIGAFDPSYPLDRVAALQAAPDQPITGPAKIGGRLSGWGASALVASNNPVFPDVWGRRTPLLEAVDRLGRPVGSALSLVRHWDGPWAGSAWLLCGIKNRSLLLDPAAQPALRRALAALLQPLYLQGVATRYACYRPGEQPRATITVRNRGDRPAKVAWRLVAFAGSTGRPALECKGEVTAAPGATPVEVPLDLPPAEPFYNLTATLSAGRTALDQAATGFCFWQPAVLAKGPALAWQANAFRVADRPLFLCGTNQTGVMFGSPLENPLVWRRDLLGMADAGLNVLRILHYSPFAMPGHTRPEADPEAGLRQLDAVVQLAQQAGVIIFLSLHDWIPVELSDADLAAQRAWARTLAERYRDVPGLMFDVQNEPNVEPEAHQEAALPLWREFLRARYGADAGLAAAWQEAAATLADALLERGREEWSSVQGADFDRFRAFLLDRWAGENIAGVKEVSPGRPCTVGYLPWVGPADHQLGGQHVDFANLHYYGPTADFPATFKWSDQRAMGRGLSVGEFGVKAHPAWGKGNEVGLTEREGVDRLLTIAHYTLGLGGSMMANWDWKDMEECIFPWGLNHPGDLAPKDFALAYRDFALLTRPFRPSYQGPPLYLLLAEEHRFGNAAGRVVKAQYAAINLLLDCQVNFNVITERDLLGLPADCRAIVWPVPYCPDEQVVQRLLQFVREGGSLLVTGDLTFGLDRRRGHTDRLEQLCGVKLVKPLAEPLEEGPETHPSGDLPGWEAHPELQVDPLGAQVLAGAKETGGVVFRHRLGQGRVLFSTDPVELHPEDGAAPLYRAFLREAGVEPVAAGLPAGLHAMSLPAAGGGMLYVLVNDDGKDQPVTLREVSFTVPRGGWGLALFDGQGRLQALEGQGAFRRAGADLLGCPGRVMVLAVDEEGIRPGGPLAAMALDETELTLPAPAAAAELGSFDRLRWQPVEQLTPTPTAAGCSITIDADRRLQPLLVGAKADLPAAAKWLEGLLRLPEPRPTG